MVVCFCTDNKIKITESWLKGKACVAILCPNLVLILLSFWSTLVSFPSLSKQKEVSINLLVKDLTEQIYCVFCWSVLSLHIALGVVFFPFPELYVYVPLFSHEKYKHKTPMLFQELWGCSNIFYVWFACLKKWRRMNCLLTRKKYTDN